MSPKDIKEKMKFIKDNMIFDIFTNLKYRKNLGNILLTVNYVAVVFRKINRGVTRIHFRALVLTGKLEYELGKEQIHSVNSTSI